MFIEVLVTKKLSVGEDTAMSKVLATQPVESKLVIDTSKMNDSPATPEKDSGFMEIPGIDCVHA
jgi:hypothetical protein